MHPPYWTAFLREHHLEQRTIVISEEADVSGVSADFTLMTDKMSREETDDFYPGIAVRADGFIAIGSCLIGSGDPYFINIHDGAGGPLYRIYHDAVEPDQYDRESAVAVVLQDYRDLAKYVRP